MHLLDELCFRLGAMDAAPFERLCRVLLPRIRAEWASIEPNLTSSGKTRPGPMDAHVVRADGRYVVFLYTTQQERVKEKILKEIERLAKDDCKVKDRIAEVVLCNTTAINHEREEYRKACEDHGWTLEPFSLNRLARELLNHDDLQRQFLSWSPGRQGDGVDQSKLPAQPGAFASEYSFDCGPRVAKIRELVALRTSRFLEFTGVASERTLLEIESGASECPDSTLVRVNVAFGASLTWLRHDEGTPLEVTYVSLRQLGQLVTVLREQEVLDLVIALDTERYLLGIAARTGQHRWQVHTVSEAIDVWKWMGEHHVALGIHDFFVSVNREFRDILSGLFMSTTSFEQVFDGRAHPGILLSGRYKQDRYWVDDITDIERRYPIADQYAKWYGEWFTQYQDSVAAIRRAG
ncbi:MAG: hypothetical protein HYV19_05590 [Gemmatimonadetes bacterium]|nr:hypothetical protein [Gemmatimonadota bacterium]